MTDLRNYELLFEGASDDSAETIRKVKGVLIADLELPVDKVREILESAPIVIQQSLQEESLKRSFNSLKRAGAKVQIVAPKATQFEENSDEGFSFELDLSGDKPQTTLHNDLETMLDDGDPDIKSEVDALLNQLSETEIVKVNRYPSAEIAAPAAKNDLEILPPEDIPELLGVEAPTLETDSNPTLAEAPPTNGWGLELEKATQGQVSPQPLIPIPDIDSASSLTVAPEPQVLKGVPNTPPKSSTPSQKTVKQKSPDMPLAQKAAPAGTRINHSATDLEESLIPDRTIGVEISLPKKRGHFELSTETIVTICLSAIVVVIGNWIFNNLQSSNVGQLSVALPTTTQEDFPSISTRDTVVLPTMTLAALSSADDHELRARIVRQGRSVVGIFLRLTTPPPPQLTPEELVRGTSPHAWLSKIEAEGLEISQHGDGSFRAQGYGRAFVDQGDLHRRLPVEVIVESGIPSPTGSVQVTVTFSRTIGAVSPLDEITPFNVSSDGTVRINFRTTFLANPTKGTEQVSAEPSPS